MDVVPEFSVLVATESGRCLFNAYVDSAGTYRIVGEGGSVRPKMAKAEIDRRLREVLGGFPHRLSAMWLNYRNTVLQRGLINQPEMTNFGGAVPNQWYWQGLFELDADDAFSLETELPGTRPYWNVQLNDELFNTVDYVFRQSSLIGHQARVDADGRFRAAISMQDPGVHNWLDPGETRRRMLIGRWPGCDGRPLPRLTKVPLAGLRAHLPAETPTISPEDRATQMRARRIGSQLRRRW